MEGFILEQIEANIFYKKTALRVTLIALNRVKLF